MLTSSTRFSSWSILLEVAAHTYWTGGYHVAVFAGVTADVFFEWLLMVNGIAPLVYPWSGRGAGAVVWQIFIGIVYRVAATFMLPSPVAGVASLTLVLSLYIFLEGVFELAVYFRLRSLRGAIWFLVDGVISLLLADLIFVQRSSSSL